MMYGHPLSGITQSEHRLSIGANWVVIGRYSIYAEWARVWRRNLGNQADIDTKMPMKSKPKSSPEFLGKNNEGLAPFSYQSR